MIYGLIATGVIFAALVAGVFAFPLNQQQTDDSNTAALIPPADVLDPVEDVISMAATPPNAPLEIIETTPTIPEDTSIQGSNSRYVVVISETDLRAGPDASHVSVGHMGIGDAAMVRACNQGCTWYLLDSGAWIPATVLLSPPPDLPIRSYVADSLAKESHSVDSEPVVLVLPTVTPTPLPLPTVPWSGATASEYAILRQGPGTTYEQVGLTLPGDPLPIVAQNVTGDWYQLDDGAWVAAFLVANRPGTLPVAANIPSPPAGSFDLRVTFTSPRYQCMQTAYGFETVKGEAELPWVYRSFQVDMAIMNLNTKPILPIYKPTRWIITDGNAERVETISWQASGSGPAAKRQQILEYDEGYTQTWYLVSLGREEWVKAVEFVWNGQIYHNDFDLNQARNDHNYKDCGEPRGGA